MKPRFAVFAVLFTCLAPLSSVNGELLVYYKFDNASDASSAVDSSGNGNSGAISVATYSADAAGHTGAAGDRAIDLGVFGNDALVEVSTAAAGSLSSISANDAATVSLWINGGAEQPAPQWTFFAGPDRQLGSHTPWSDGTMYFDVAGCCGATQRIAKNEPDSSKYKDGWNHYAFVKDGTSTAIYQNGALFHDSGADAKDALGDITEFVLGAGPSGDRRSYAGMMDDVAIWDTALSADRIADIAAGGQVPEPSTGLLAVLGAFMFGLRVRRKRS